MNIKKQEPVWHTSGYYHDFPLEAVSFTREILRGHGLIIDIRRNGAPRDVLRPAVR